MPGELVGLISHPTKSSTLRFIQHCLSCCTINTIGGDHAIKIASENNYSCHRSMTLCPKSSWQKSGRGDKISTSREFLKVCSHAATQQHTEKGEPGDNGGIVSADICWSFPWGSSSSLSLIFHWELGHFTLFVHPSPPLKHADVPGADPKHPLACQHSLCANWQ